MKKYAVILFLIIGTFAIGQMTTIETTIPFKHSDETAWIRRYQHDIDKYYEENKNLKDLSCDVLFLGSSTINLWNTIYQDFAPLNIIRRSYGGAALRDMLYNYNVIARGYNPKKIVVYVENDLGSGKEGVSAVKCFDLFRIFIGQLKKDYPNVPLYIISLKPSEYKAGQRQDQLLVNTLLEQYAKEVGYTYIDITKVMYDRKGQLRKDIFIEDKLHMNAEGYKLWTNIIKPYLMK